MIKGTKWEGTYCPKPALDLITVGSGRMEFGAYHRAVLPPWRIFEECSARRDFSAKCSDVFYLRELSGAF